MKLRGSSTQLQDNLLCISSCFIFYLYFEFILLGFVSMLPRLAKVLRHIWFGSRSCEESSDPTSDLERDVWFCVTLCNQLFDCLAKSCLVVKVLFCTTQIH